eukprot:CAMPEP_0197444722 /NCGR_PEP_ID=MMETSP1175-20131217/10137_1 /TAXON_ID=1003142 /ORGANISM="Triceratium dubium, Strain CCMP147" /LENGTH=469 /DNA_ID=CAMNT_0042975561 /DNA_START=79 /DNA_END=1488 /DNA_ORIENTATION=+
MMFRAVAVSAYLLSATVANGFVATTPPVSSSKSSSSSSVPAKKVLPPPSLDDMDVAATFDERVQKTYGRFPLTLVSGKGCNVYSDAGDEYLDFVSGIATCALGHSNPELNAAISEQMSALHHVSNLYLIPRQAQLAAWLCENSVADKAFFCNSGAEANEGAIKLARKHASNRGITDPVIVTAKQSFHGRTLAALSATGQPKYHEGFGYGGEMVRGFEFVTYNDAEELEAKVKEVEVTPEEDAKAGRKRGLAAIMMEPLQGEGGIIPGDPAFFAAARKLCDDTGALLLCDEVQVGMGRTGTLWGYENVGVEPDVFTSAKALGGGVPIGAMMARGEAANVLSPGTHASTYGGNPLACAAGVAVATYIAENDVLDNVRERGEQLSEGLASIGEKYPSILGGVRGWGLLKGVEVKEDAGCTAGELVGDAMKEGLLLVPAGPNVVRFVPPLVVTEEEVDKALERFEKAVEKRAG